MPNKPLLKIMKAQSEEFSPEGVFDCNLPVYFLVSALFFCLSPSQQNELKLK